VEAVVDGLDMAWTVLLEPGGDIGSGEGAVMGTREEPDPFEM
jgi:hypothetical protein